MALLGVSNLTKAFGTDLLFEGVSFEVQANDKIGVVGVNGSGKTTLFKMITGEMRPDDGELYQSKQAVVGYMEQHVCKNLEETALDEVLTVFTPLMKMEEEIELLNVRLQKGMGSAEELIERQALLNDRFVREGGMTYRSRARSALLGLGFSGEDMALTVGALSGGQKAKLQLAKMLLSGANLLLLDEPTSYLDIRYKLEFMSVLQELARRKKVAVILSIHELDLAERVSDWVLCVSPGQESRFGRPEEMLTPEHLSELFQIEEGRFRQTGGSMELPRPEGAPEVFVLAGGGSGRAVFWQLQRAGTTFAAGIVSEADLDYPAACTLASRLIAVPAFEEISEEKEQEARECLDACQCVIACRRQYGGWAAANDRLLAYAREKGKKIEYHNLPLHKMQ